MTANLEWAAELAEEHKQAAERNRKWHEHYRGTMPPGRARRSRLWLLSYHAARAERRAEFFRALAQQVEQ